MIQLEVFYTNLINRMSSSQRGGWRFVWKVFIRKKNNIFDL